MDRLNRTDDRERKPWDIIVESRENPKLERVNRPLQIKKKPTKRDKSASEPLIWIHSRGHAVNLFAMIMLIWRALLLNLHTKSSVTEVWKFYSTLTPDRKSLSLYLFIIHKLKCEKLKSD